MWPYWKYVVYVAIVILRFRGDEERNDVSITSMEILAYADVILVPIAVPLICK